MLPTDDLAISTGGNTSSLWFDSIAAQLAPAKGNAIISWRKGADHSMDTFGWKSNESFTEKSILHRIPNNQRVLDSIVVKKELFHNPKHVNFLQQSFTSRLSYSSKANVFNRNEGLGYIENASIEKKFLNGLLLNHQARLNIGI